MFSILFNLKFRKKDRPTDNQQYFDKSFVSTANIKTPAHPSVCSRQSKCCIDRLVVLIKCVNMAARYTHRIKEGP